MALHDAQAAVAKDDLVIPVGPTLSPLADLD